MKMSWFVRINSALITLLLVCSIPAEAQTTKVNVIATFSILGDLVKNVGGDYIQLTMLVGPNDDAHSFEPTPQDGIKLTKAQIIFENGLYFEQWLDDLYEASQSKALRVVVTDGVVALNDNVDPHAWHNVTQVIAMVNNIKEAFISVDPAHQASYENNAANYLNQLNALESWIIIQVQQIQQERRKLVTNHDTFGYFAEHYGFNIIGTAIESASGESAEPSARQMTILINKIKAAGVPTIFTENINNPKIMRMLADEAKVQVAPALYTDALGEAGSAGDSYIKMMKYNVTVITEGLK